MAKINEILLIYFMTILSQSFSMIPDEIKNSGKQEINNTQVSIENENNIKEETYFTSIEKNEKNIIIKFKLNIDDPNKDVATCSLESLFKITVFNKESRLEIILKGDLVKYYISYYLKTECSHKHSTTKPYKYYKKYGELVNINKVKLFYKDQVLTITIEKKRN